MGTPFYRLNLAPVLFGVIDENDHSYRIIESCLRGFGVELIHRFVVADVALQRMEMGRPDIVICNFHTPPLGGCELTRRLRRGPLGALPVIMMATEPTHTMVREARDAGVDEFVAKPISPDVLWWRIFNVVNHQRAFITTDDFVGPCRRRRHDPFYDGPKRRSTDKARDDDQVMSEDAVEELMRSLGNSL